MSNSNTPTITPATLSEQELFADVLDTEFVRRNILGDPMNDFPDTIRGLMSLVYMDRVDLSGVGYQIVDEVSEADDPEETLDVIISDFRGALAELETAREAFVAFKGARRIKQVDDDDEARYTASASTRIMSRVDIDRLSPKLREALQALKVPIVETEQVVNRRAEMPKRLETLMQMALVAAENDPQNMESYADCGGAITGYIMGMEGWDNDKVDFIEIGHSLLHQRTNAGGWEAIEAKSKTQLDRHGN